jgi:hypothetical protein
MQVLMKRKAAETAGCQAAFPGVSPNPGGESLQWPEDVEEERAFAACSAELSAAAAAAAAAVVGPAGLSAAAAAAVGPWGLEETAAAALVEMGAASGSAKGAASRSAKGAEGSSSGAGKVSLSIGEHGANRRQSGFIPKNGGIPPREPIGDRPISTQAEADLFARLAPHHTSRQGVLDITGMRTGFSQAFYQQLRDPALDPQGEVFVDPQKIIYTKSREHLEVYGREMALKSKIRNNIFYNQRLGQQLLLTPTAGAGAVASAAAAAATTAAAAVPAAAATAAVPAAAPKKSFTQMRFSFKRPASASSEPAAKQQRADSSAQPAGSSAQPAGSSAQPAGSSAQPGGWLGAAAAAAAAVARALSPKKPAAPSATAAPAKSDRSQGYICVPCALIKKELVLKKGHTCCCDSKSAAGAAAAAAAQAAAVERMPLCKNGRTFKLAEYLALSGVREKTHWGKAVKDNPLLATMRWTKCICEKCSLPPPK